MLFSPLIAPGAFAAALVTYLIGLTAFAASNEGEHLCHRCAPAVQAVVGPDSPEYRRFSRDRVVDFTHLALDVTPDFSKRTMQGIAKLQFKPISKPLEELRLDAVNLSVRSVSFNGGAVKFRTTERELVVNFGSPVAVGQAGELRVEYSAEPVKGLYFRTREMGYPQTQIWTQGESIESRHWFPCFDDPSEKLTTEVVCRVPAGMVAVSNGHLKGVTKDASGLEVFHWVQEKPHVNYLVALVAGELEKVEDRHGEVPLEFWTIPADSPKAWNTFRYTRRMMEFFEREIGVPYPWARYGQVAIRDYHWGGMENTTITTLNANTLFSPETENLYDSDGLVAHELAHQWFGDLVTCKDWSHTWLNEGFATYYAWLWVEDFWGSEEFRMELLGNAKGIIEKAPDVRGIVSRRYRDPGEMFNYLAYPKGGWVLHMLRSQLGEELYRRCVKTYLERYAYTSVTTENFRSVLEEVTGLSFERFFDQWVYGVGVPFLEVNHEWDEKTGLAKVSVKQAQPISEEARLFQFPLRVRFQAKNQVVERVLEVREKEEDFYVQLGFRPELVRVDPGVELLAKIQFRPGREMLLRQLSEAGDPVGQWLAMEQLSEKPDREVVEKVGVLLGGKSNFRVRARAVEVLKQARSQEALDLLVSAVRDSEPRVRNAVVGALGGFYAERARDVLLEVAGREANPGIVGTALKGLGPYPGESVRAALVGGLGRACYRERIAEGALGGMRAQADPFFAVPVMDAVRERGAEWPSGTVANALETLGILMRAENERGEARLFLTNYLEHPVEKVRLGAIGGLGNLEDPRAIAVLETCALMSPERPERGAAEKALEKIRLVRKGAEELGGLRSELLELRKVQSELRKDLDAVRKRQEVRSEGGRGGPGKTGK